MTTAGHRLVTPTYTGLGERVHLANPAIDLEVHIKDVLGLIKYEQLHDIVLIGHSYDGMVATGVADRVPDLIAKLGLPGSLCPGAGRFAVTHQCAAHALRLPHLIKTFETPLRLQNGATQIPRTYIYCKRTNPEDTFRPFAERARREHWSYREIDASHSPHITAPGALSELLQSVIATR